MLNKRLDDLVGIVSLYRIKGYSIGGQGHYAAWILDNLEQMEMHHLEHLKSIQLKKQVDLDFHLRLEVTKNDLVHFDPTLPGGLQSFHVSHYTDHVYLIGNFAFFDQADLLRKLIDAPGLGPIQIKFLLF